MLEDVGHQVGHFACLCREDFAFAEDDVFLQVDGYRLRGAEIFHGVGDGYAHFFTQAEEIVDGGLGLEDNGGEVAYRDFLLAEFASRESFDFDEGAEYYVETVFFG